MESRKRAWAYCSIDAPEDENETLKKQRRQLMEYAGQMGFEVAGSSSDAGQKPLWERPGFKRFVDAAARGEVDILLVASRRCLTHSSMQIAQLQALANRNGNIPYTFPDGYVCDCGHSGQRGGKLPDRLKTFVSSALIPAAMFVGYGYR